jgi:hypothetical protein
MVDVEQINREFKLFFRVLGPWEIDHTGLINVQGAVDARDTLPGPHLPVQFGFVQNHFDLNQQDNLLDLQGAPHTVGGEFFVKAPEMTHLTGAPRRVGGRCVLRSQSLKSLEHLPESCHLLRIDMSPTLPLLRLTETTYPIQWGYPIAHGASGNPKLKLAADIIGKYRGTGKSGAIKAAAELIKAGCKENARW